MYNLNRSNVNLREPYNQKKVRYRKICQFLKEKAKKSVNEFPDVADAGEEVNAILIVQEKYASNLRECAEKNVPSVLVKELEEKILSFIPKRLKESMPSKYQSILRECKEEWNESLHNYVTVTIICGPGRIGFEGTYRGGGITENYAQFLKNKQKIRDSLFIVHPFMTDALKTSTKRFPRYLIEFDRYRCGYVVMSDLIESFDADLKQSEALIADEWYPQLIARYRLPKSVASIPPRKCIRLLKCTENFISLRIVLLIKRTIEFMIELTQNRDALPQIDMELEFNGKITISPSFDEILAKYCWMIDSIASVCRKLPNLHKLIELVSDNEFITVRLYDSFFETCYGQLRTNLTAVYEPVYKYVADLNEKYHSLINSDDYDRTDAEILHEKIRFYKRNYESLALMSENEYFDIGRLHQEKMINDLKDYCMNLHDGILNDLCESHKRRSRGICKVFEDIVAKVTSEPEGAADLIEIGTYCMHVKTEKIDELRDNIAECVVTMCELIEIATFSDDHIEYNTKMVTWLNDIMPILNKSSLDYEVTKYEMEENLIATTNKLGQKATDLLPYLTILDEMDDINNTLAYLEEIQVLDRWIRECEEELIWINKEETVFKFPVTQFSDLEELKAYVQPFYELIYLLHKWRRSYFSWMDGPFEKINRELVKQQHDDYSNKIAKMSKDFKNKIKQQIADNNPRRFKGLVDDPDIMNLPAPLKLCAQALNELENWKPWVQLVNIMCNPALRQRHWDDMSKISDVDLTPNAGTTVRKMIALNLWDDMDKYEIISIGASKELALKTNLDKMNSEWIDVSFGLTTYEDTDLKVLAGVDNIQTLLDDHIVKSLAMRGSAFVKPFEAEVKTWCSRLLRINSSIEQWTTVQQRWLHFLPLFKSKNIARQLQSEEAIFQQVSDTHSKYLTSLEDNPRVMEVASGFKLLNDMKSANESLEQVNDGINNYVEKIRIYFSRFFFLSTSEIVEILSETENPLKVQAYLPNCFEGIYKLEFDDNYNIVAIISKECEKIEFKRSVSTDSGGLVEKWLLRVEEEMLASVYDRIKLSYADYPKRNYVDWVKSWEAMAVLCVSQIYWTQNVHECLGKSPQNLKDLLDALRRNLNDLIGSIRSNTLSNNNRIKLKALIVITVHTEDVIRKLIDVNVRKDDDFTWLAQLRYYWQSDNVYVHMINCGIKYAYEYLGNTDRLVITPITDRCYRTLIGAFDLNLYGAPEGPAGTGKTETVKDLAKALAKRCIVFNCSENLSYELMGRYFKGLATSGAWACFDELNRINVEVLSVIAQQLLTIIRAVREKSTMFNFEGTVLKLNPTLFACVTMNPGYAGRSELPNNLRLSLRSVSMMVPDYLMIAEISLYSYGYLRAGILSRKIMTVFKLCSESLSTQNHYDFGMRALKSVLSSCADYKLTHSDDNEDLLVLRSISYINLPKFLSYDTQAYEDIVADIFPGTIMDNLNDELQAIDDVCSRLNLQINDYFRLKINQVYQTMKLRHGLMLVGDPLSGKTSVLNVLSDAGVMECCNINPKSITCDQLFGYVDNATSEWNEGIVSKIFRNYSRSGDLGRKWIVFDGPVDAIWIENLNTVLDDNRTLCLVSGEIIPMTNSMSLVFEVVDLAHASPATVSRCGMIYMESGCLGHEPFVKSWIDGCNPVWKDGFEDLLRDLCNWIFSSSFNFLRINDVKPAMNLVVSTLSLISMIMNDAVSAEEDLKYVRTWIQASFVFSSIWGFGGSFTGDFKLKFDQFTKDLWKSDAGITNSTERIEVSIPIDGSLSDYVYQYKQKGSWKQWQDIVKNTKMTEAADLQQMLVPSVESAICGYFIDLHVRYNKPIVLIGPTSTGKTFCIQNYINRLSIDKYTPILTTFTTASTARATQDFILSKLYKLKNNVYGPRHKRTAILFIDDMNTPSKEIYGAQPPIELLRQYLDKKMWYDVKSSDKINISDVLVLAAMGVVGGCRQSVSPRMLRHFNSFYINEFSDDTIGRIFTNLIQIGLRRNGFGNDVTPYINSIISSTIYTYKCISEKLLPSIVKPHYLFNIRDIGRVIQGCSLVRKDSIDNKKVLIKLWLHEAMRVFYDRLTDENDRNWLFDVFKQCVVDHFKEEFDGVCENLQNEEGIVTEAALSGLMFGTYLDADNGDVKKYEEVCNVENFFKKATAVLEEYNSVQKNELNIVLFENALENLSKLCRVLSMPGSSALLVGISGSGRQSLTKLASAIAEFKLFQPNCTNDYDVKSWREDLKKLLKQAGGHNEESTFLLSEEQILDESFLQDVNNILNSGDVPNLFEYEEEQEILELVRLAAQGGNRNLDIHPLKVYAFFTARCKAKLHMSICLSPVGSSLRKRLMLYPSLINCCTVIWFKDWPEEALERVATKYVMEIELPEEIQSIAVKMCQQFHINARNVSEDYLKHSKKSLYVTSASYINMMNLYVKLMREKQCEISTAKQRYMNGLDKLNMAAEAVENMQRELNELKPQLIVMAVKGAEMMEEIERETIEADKATIQVREDEKVANEQAAGAQELKKDCEADLALAIPILEDAIAALNTLKPTDITLVKSMKNPPAAIKLVMAAVCVMKSIPPDRIPDPSNPGRKMLDFWGPSKRLLGDMAFLQSLKEYDKDNIPPAIMAKIRKEYLPHKDFKPHIIAKASTAAEGLCKWVIAMDMYDAVAKVVAPKKAKLLAAEAEFAATMAVLDEKKAMVARLEKRVADLNAALEEANLKKQELEDEVEMCINKLNRAEKLIGGLGGEKSRWTTAAENLQSTYDNLVGDILLSSAILTYLSPFPSSVRLPVITDWKVQLSESGLPLSESFSLPTVLGSDVEIQNWYILGLPRDQISTDNAIIYKSSIKWPLFVDPQGQACKWIKKMEQSNDMCLIKLSDPDYMDRLEHSIESGRPVLLESICEKLPPPLNPILFRNLQQTSDKTTLKLGKNIIDYNENFRLYLSTKDKSPQYPPEVFIKVTVIDFSLSVDGLVDQLLGIVVAKERPDLQEQREQLIVEAAQNIIELKNVEDNILKTLHESKGDILEDEEAIDILDSSKILANEILKRKKAAKITKRKIDEFRDLYLPLATHSANIYYSVTDLPNINPMYQFSLSWFINLYVYSIERANKSKDLSKRLNYLIDTFTYNLYCNVCRSLFEKDRMIFSFLLCSQLTDVKVRISEEEIKFFLNRSLEDAIDNPIDWLPNEAWQEIHKFDKMANGFEQSFKDSQEDWKKIFDSPEPQNETLPKPWDSKLTDFQRLIVLKILRLDKLIDALSVFVRLNMDEKFVSPPHFDIRKTYTESNCLVPMIFIDSNEVDSYGALLKFSEKIGYSSKLNTLSLGQKQGPLAESLIRRAQSEGSWVCLQNCHLAISWLPELENICESFNLTNTDVNFRLWLTTYPSEKFPKSILQSSIKMTNETPHGLKNNLLQLYTSEPISDMSFYGGCSEKDKIFSKMLYAVSFFHTIALQRKKFGSLGWNVQYFFNASDFNISVRQVQKFLNQYDYVAYDALLYLIGECNYGGKVTDDWDKRFLMTILTNLLNDNINNRDFKLSADFGLPKYCEYQDYLKHIRELPDSVLPETYGLNENAGIFSNVNTANQFLDSLMKIKCIDAVEIKFENVGTICADILNKLPEKINNQRARNKFPYSYEESLNTFLVQEIDKYNVLLNVIRNSLENVKKSVLGLVVLTEAIEEEAYFIMEGRVPNSWRKYSYPTLRPLTDYVADLVERISVLNLWIEEGRPSIFWISGFFNIHAFLTAHMQNYARIKKLSIDDFILDCEVGCNVQEEPGSFYVKGIYIEGAKWNATTMMLEEQNPRILKEKLPSLKIMVIERRLLCENGRYKCPMYKTGERRGVLDTLGHSTNYVMSLMLPSSKLSSHWIKRSVAMILE